MQSFLTIAILWTMAMGNQTVRIRSWKPASGVEPLVRVGVVLEADEMQAIDLQTPAPIRVRLDGDMLIVETPGKPAERIARYTFSPADHGAMRRGGGVLVKGVVAGRGFHWQKRVDQTLAGQIEILPRPRGLVLVNTIPLESYLACVVTSEMSSACPINFLRAQTIAARSWLLALTESKHDDEPFDRCNDDCCQRYQGTGDLSDVAIEAVQSTRGMVLTADDGKLIVDANYSKSCGGVVEIPEHIWGKRKPGLAALVDAPAGSNAQRFLPVTDENLREYLAGDWLAQTDVYCSPRVVPEDQLGKYLGRVDESGEYFRWTIRYSHDELLELLRAKLPEAAGIARIDDLRVTKRGVSGRATEIVIAGADASGGAESITIKDQYRIRQTLHKSFLYSSAFAVTIERDGDGKMKSLTLRGAGWGHGAGLCQIGALGMALQGIDHETIVKHYFPAAELRRVY